MLTRIKRLASQSTWGKVGRSRVSEDRAFMMQVGYPVFDLCCIMFGIFGTIGGIPALKDTFGEDTAFLWAIALGIGGLVCLIGVAYPYGRRFWKVEYYGKCFLTGMLGCYAAAIFIAGISVDEVGRFAVGFIILAVNVIPFSRVMQIAQERGGK